MPVFSLSLLHHSRLRSRSRGRCSSSRRRCPTSAAPSWARRPRPSLGSSRRRTRAGRRATRRLWWARRLMVMTLLLLQPPPPLLLSRLAWLCAVASRRARRRAAAVVREVVASGRRGGRPRRAGGARTRPAGLGAGEGVRGLAGRLRSRSVRWEEGSRGVIVAVMMVMDEVLLVL